MQAQVMKKSYIAGLQVRWPPDAARKVGMYFTDSTAFSIGSMASSLPRNARLAVSNSKSFWLRDRAVTATQPGAAQHGKVWPGLSGPATRGVF